MSDRGAEPIDAGPIRDRIEAGLTALFSEPAPQALDELTRLVLLLAQWAPRMNLTGHRDPLEMTSRLVLDAAALVTALPELTDGASVADLGSGAGFPGLPIAILRPRLTVYLVESRQKRHHFQREARRQLELDNAIPVLGRSNQVEVRPSDVVVAQAMAQPEQAIASMMPWTRPGGAMAIPATIESSPPSLPDGLRVERRHYRVPLSGIDRQVWIVRRPVA
ncbi:class I SAM-dependent methyltransferase [Myxococcota bacterium]|nr:class I SAM-dependent methyltransferase [Myxococcota bacterium]